MNAVVCEISIGENTSVTTWSRRHVPSVNFFASVVDHADKSWTGEMCKESVALGHGFLIDTTKANAASVNRTLLHVVYCNDVCIRKESKCRDIVECSGRKATRRLFRRQAAG